MSLNKFFSPVLFLLVLFPYVSLINTPFDTQPYALIMSFMTILLYWLSQKDLQIPKVLSPFILIFIYACLAFASESSMVGLRSLIGYTTICFISLAAYLSFDDVKGNHFSWAVVTWLFFGLIQQFVSKGFGDFLVPRLSTSLTRGVTSLAVEPSYYSIVCIFFLLLNDIFLVRGEYGKEKYRNLFILILIQFLLSRSGLGIFLFFVYLLSKPFSQMTVERILKWIIGISLFTVLVLFLFEHSPTLQATRVGGLISLFLQSPKYLLMVDQSASDRFSHISIPIVSLLYNKGLGFGFGAWDANAMAIADKVGGFIYEVASVNISYGNRIMSGWGSAFFELGVFGVLLYLGFFYIMIRGAGRSKGDLKTVYLSSLITLSFTVLMAVPLAFPLFGYIIGVFARLQFNEESLHLTGSELLIKSNR